MSDSIIQPEDARFYVEVPDSSFSPQRNKAIIEEVNRDTEKFFNSLQNKLHDKMYEKMDMVTSYGLYRFNKGTKSFSDYVGKDILKQLAIEKLTSRGRLVNTMERLQRL